MPMIDTLIEARWIIPVEPHNTVLEDHVIAIKDGKIVSVMPQHQWSKIAYTAHRHFRFKDHAIIPGLINAHAHSPMTLVRGIADDLPLMTWLNEHIWPTEKRWLDQGFVQDGTRLACAEMLLSGTTCFNEHYFFGETTAKVAKKLGMRCAVGIWLGEHETPYAKDLAGYIAKGLAWYKDYEHDPLIKMTLAPHSPYTLQNSSLQRLHDLQRELQCPIHMHVHESKDEIEHSLSTYQQRPLQRLQRHQLLSKDFMGVHLTQLTPDDINIIKDSHMHAIHCPQSNAMLASGSCPIANLKHQGINIALGTDSAASNNDLNMFAEMQCAAQWGKQQQLDPTAITAADALRMATLNGAKALGIDHQVGSIEVGKAADLVAIDFRHPATQPVYQPIGQTVYAAGRDRVSHVWVNGKLLLRNGGFTKWPIHSIMEKTKDWGRRIRCHHHSSD